MISPRLAALGDRICLALLLLTLGVEFTGGIRFGEGWSRVSVTSPWRLAMFTLALVVVRHLIVRHPSLRERLIARRQARSSSGWPGLRLYLPTTREWLLAALLLGAATAFTLWEQIRMPTGVPDLGDPLFSMWRLSTIAHQLANDPWHLFDGGMYFPAANTLAYSDAILLPGFIAAPFLWAGVPVAFVYTGLYVGSFWLAGMAMFLLVRTLTRQFTPALLAGVLFAFYPYRFSGYSHLEKQGTFFMPVALLLLIRLLQGGRARDGVLLGLCVGLQALWSIYLGAFLAVSLAAVMVVRWAAGHFLWRERARGLIASGLVAAVVVGPYILPYWRAREAVGERSRDEAITFSATPADLFAVSPRNRLYGPYLDTSENHERSLFPGATAVVLAGVALIPPFSPLAGAALAGLVVSVDGAFGRSGATFPWLYDTIPPFRAFRAPGRFSLVVGLFVCLLAGFGLFRVLGRSPSRSRQVAAAGIIAFGLFELQPNLELQPVPTSAPPIYAALPDQGDAVLVDLPVPSDFNVPDFTYIYNSTFHRRRLLNGVSGFIPPGYARVVAASAEFPSSESVASLRRLGADYAVVHGDFYEPDVFGRIVSALDGRPDAELVAARPSPGGREDRLYRLR